MGLDVYLYRYNDFEGTSNREHQYSEGCEKIWDSVEKSWDEMTEEEKDKCRKECDKLAEKLGLTPDGVAPPAEKEMIEFSSQKYPDHMFKIGYFRSSYNSGGLNTVLDSSIGKSLYDIFDVEDDYEVRPDWGLAKEKAEKVLKEYKEFLASGAFDVTTIRGPMVVDRETLPKSPKEAVEHFKKELEEYNKKSGGDYEFSAYSSAYGEFRLKDPMRVRAILHGHDNLFEHAMCLYVVREWEKEAYEWYIQALEIVIETCEYVIKRQKTDKSEYVLIWSG